MRCLPLRRSSKSQPPTYREPPKSKHHASSSVVLGLEAWLFFGAWNLKLFARTFFVRSKRVALSCFPFYGDDKTFCGIAAASGTGSADLRTALRCHVLGRSARHGRRQSAQLPARQQA